MNKHQVAKLVKRAPAFIFFAQTLYRLTQPRFTAGVVGVILNDVGQLLMVEHVFHPKYPWGLPGGWMGRRENPADGALRELREETGLQAEVIKPLLITRSTYVPFHFDISFLCHTTSTEVHLSDELLSHRWLTFEEASRIPMVTFHQHTLQAAQAECGMSLEASGAQKR